METKDELSSSHDASVRKLGELIKDIEFAMLTTVDDDGKLHSRPMATQKAEFDGTLWFFTKADSPKTHEIDHDTHVNVSFARPDRHRYVSCTGKAQLVRDQTKAQELWSPFYKTWFPEGLADPQLALIRVDVEQAEYWDASGKMMQLFKRFTTGKLTEEDHKKLDMTG